MDYFDINNQLATLVSIIVILIGVLALVSLIWVWPLEFF